MSTPPFDPPFDAHAMLAQPGPADGPRDGLGDPENKARFRTIFISDFHLGTRRTQAGQLLDFLKHTESDELYLVGDIIDNWSLARTWYWAQEHNDVIQKLLRKARKGTAITYIPGNHDSQFRDFCGQAFGNVRVERETVHTTADGRRYLVLHGDKFDGVVLYAEWLAHLGDVAYSVAVASNVVVNKARRLLRMPYWSLSAYLKRRVKRAVEFVSRFEVAMARAARRADADGVVCGHIHTAEERWVDGIHYCNDGDWMESCTALVEHADGRLELIDWSRDRARLLGENAVVPFERRAA